MKTREDCLKHYKYGRAIRSLANCIEFLKSIDEEGTSLEFCIKDFVKRGDYLMKDMYDAFEPDPRFEIADKMDLETLQHKASDMVKKQTTGSNFLSENAFDA